MKALDECGRRWRIAFCSPSVAGIQTAVLAGLAIGVLGDSALVPGMRALGAEEGMPALPLSEIELHRRPGEISPAATRLAEHIVELLQEQRT